MLLCTGSIRIHERNNMKGYRNILRCKHFGKYNNLPDIFPGETVAGSVKMQKEPIENRSVA